MEQGAMLFCGLVSIMQQSKASIHHSEDSTLLLPELTPAELTTTNSAFVFLTDFH